MKRLKQIAGLLLALALLLALCACGEDPAKVQGTVAPTDNAASVTGSVDATKAPDVQDTGDTQAPDAAQDLDYEVGSMQGGVYSNEFLGIGCTLDENWSYYTEEQIQELNGLVEESFSSDEELAELLEGNEVIYDMYAAADDGLVTININFENLGVLYGTVLDEDSYLDIAMESVPTALESMGFSNVAYEKVSVEFAGAARSGLLIQAELEGVAIYEEVICIKQGSYMGIITLACYLENILPELESLFYAL